MFRQIIAASALAFMTTGALAQGDTPVERNVDDHIDRIRTDYDARFTDYDARMAELDARLTRLEEGSVEGAAQAGEGLESTIEANNDQDSDLVGTEQ